jgi:hypothetical protein
MSKASRQRQAIRDAKAGRIKPQHTSNTAMLAKELGLIEDAPPPPPLKTLPRPEWPRPRVGILQTVAIMAALSMNTKEKR